MRSSDAGEAGGSIYELRGTPADVPSATSRTRHRASGRRAIDEFLDEIKSRETLRCLGAQVEGDPSPADQIAYPTAVDDAQNYESTNLFIGNLASTVTEEKLRQVFGVYGEIYSIKIMWPRSEEERRRSRNKGFVSFVRRASWDRQISLAVAGTARRCGGRAQRHGRQTY